jgi:hypothetical protein
MIKAKWVMLSRRYAVVCCMLVICLGGGAWRHHTLRVMTTAKDATLAVPTGLVQRVGDRSVMLHWEPVGDAHLAGYRVYRVPSLELFLNRKEPSSTAQHRYQ